jgi:hypothetical protein
MEMNYPAASHGVSKARQQHENHLEASFGVWTRGAITSAAPTGEKFPLPISQGERYIKRKIRSMF